MTEFSPDILPKGSKPSPEESPVHSWAIQIEDLFRFIYWTWVQTEVEGCDPASKSSSLVSESFCVINQDQTGRGKKQILDLYHQSKNEVYPVSHKSQTKVYINLRPDTFLPSIRSSIVLV